MKPVKLVSIMLFLSAEMFAQLSTPVFKPWGTTFVGVRPLVKTGATGSPVCTGGIGVYGVIAQASLAPSLAGTVCLDATWMDNSSGAGGKPAPASGSITVQWLLDGVALGARIVGPPVGLSWNTTTTANGTHVISLRIVDSTGATYAASQFFSVGQTVIVNNSGSPLGTGAQTIPVTGMYHDSIRDSPAVDFLTYSGTPPHNTVYAYPYQFVAPTTSATVRPLGSGWFVESLNEARTSANQVTPRLFTTQGGGVVVSGFYHQAPGSTADSVYPAVEHHAHFDGGRDDNSISAYSTFVWHPVGGPCPTAGGWVGVDVAKRIFCVSETGAVVTIAGYQPLTSVLQYAWQDVSISDALLDAKANNIGNLDLEAPTDLVFDPRNAKIMYVADLLNNRIAKIDFTGSPPVLTNYAGCDPTLACNAVNGGGHTSSTQGPSTGGSGYVDGAAQSARFDQPISLDMKSDGTMYIADFYNSAIRVINSAGTTVSTLVGGTVCSGCTVPSTAVVNASRDTYSSPTPVAFSAAMMPYPQVVRLDSNNNLVIGESVSRKVRLVNVGTTTVTRLYSFVSGNPSWIWLEVDKVGTIGPINDILLLTSVDPGFGNTRVVRLAEDLSYEGQLGNNGVPPDGIIPVLDSAGHYPWVMAISRTEARFIVYGFAGSSGLGEWRLKQSNDLANFDATKYNHGRRMFQMGTVEGPVADSQAITPWPGWGNRPAFTSRFGYYGNNHLGMPTFDDLQVLYPTDAALAAYIQAGMGGTIPRPEITGNDLRDMVYYIRRSSLQNGSERKPKPIDPGPDTPDPTAPLTSNIVATRTGPTTMTVTWDTNLPCIGFVAWGSTSDYNGWSAVEPGYATIGHIVNVTGMPDSLLTHFTVAAKTVGGKQTHSADAVLSASGLVIRQGTVR